MRYLLAILFLTIIVTILGTAKAEAARTRGYFKNSGTDVKPYYRSSPNSYKWDNYSSKGNINPYTGKRGYKSWY